jgi:pimeloyl-ACP methyl ester carboxylesterase
MVQVAISADPRYGPIYNLGVARAMRDNLVRHGYHLDSRTPVTLLGWSGGAQIALGAAWYLPGLIGAPVRIVSVGGVMSDDIGIQRMTHMWHLWGQKDPLAPMGEKLYAGRWKVYPNSDWNRALADGRITLIQLGNFTHNGKGNYFDNEMTLANGETHMQHVLAQVKQVLTAECLATE